MKLRRWKTVLETIEVPETDFEEALDPSEVLSRVEIIMDRGDWEEVEENDEAKNHQG